MDLLERFKCDKSAEALAALVQYYRPLVATICRRYFRVPADVDDACQNILAKLVRHSEGLGGGPVAWLTATAHSTCVDMIRKDVRQRRRVQGLAAQMRQQGEGKGVAGSETEQLAQMEAALRDLDPASRQLLMERFFQRTPLRVLAGRENSSVTTVGRRVTGALEELKKVMGVVEAQDREAAESCHDESLRFAVDWQSIGIVHSAGEGGLVGGFRPGWTRRIRVGAMVSHLCTTTSSSGFFFPVEQQLEWSGHMGGVGYDVVGIVEPQTSELGHIERAVRDYELNAGLIEGNDAAALATLDVIVLPALFAVRLDVLQAVCSAVEGGVGLYNQWWKLRANTDELAALVGKLMLADSPIGMYHTPRGHGWPMPAVVHEAHPIIAGLAAGTELLIPGCGPIYRTTKSARVLVSKCEAVRGEDLREMAPTQMPSLIVGSLGRGRVVVDHQGVPPLLTMNPALRGGFVTNVLDWLAEGARGVTGE